MSFFVFQHMFDDRLRGALAQYRKLAFINPYGTVFAGMIHTNDAVHQLIKGRLAGQPVRVIAKVM